MSTEALNRIIKEAKALTPEERHELIDQLAHEEQNSPKQLGLRNPGSMNRMVVKPELSRLSNRDTEITADKSTLREWLSMRTELPLTSDSVEIVKELREVRSR
jgi:hypothetical protein